MWLALRHFILFFSQVFSFLIITAILPGRNYNYLYFIDEETAAWINCFTFLRSHRKPIKASIWAQVSLILECKLLTIMSHWTLKKEVQNPIVLSVLIRSIAANLDLQIKLDLDFVHQWVKSFLWNKGRWAGSALLSLLTDISICDSGVNLHTWAPDGGSCLTHSISRRIQFHHSDTQCTKDVQRLMLAILFLSLPKCALQKEHLREARSGLMGYCRVAGGSWWERGSSEHTQCPPSLWKHWDKRERQNPSLCVHSTAAALPLLVLCLLWRPRGGPHQGSVSAKTDVPSAWTS